ncbi:hypothetical protein C8R47DRAFT_1321723 [Mycena vitilis]|nr:hypothetical protein C8R47DRAFT_109873 [Mycena vitilis]KAJ6483538.1 hypothetical protein C8R47DRAFT_1321723 [Mycena vitilis]
MDCNEIPPLTHASAVSLPIEVPPPLTPIDEMLARERMAVVLREQENQRIVRYLERLKQKRRGSVLLEPNTPLSLDDLDCSDMPELADVVFSDDDESSDDDDVPALIGEDGSWEDERFVRAPGAGVFHNVQYTTSNLAAAFQSHQQTSGGTHMSYDYACQAPMSQYSAACRARTSPDDYTLLLACDGNYRLKHGHVDGEAVERGWAIASGWAINPSSRSKL